MTMPRHNKQDDNLQERKSRFIGTPGELVTAAALTLTGVAAGIGALNRKDGNSTCAAQIHADEDRIEYYTEKDSDIKPSVASSMPWNVHVINKYGVEITSRGTLTEKNADNLLVRIFANQPGKNIRALHIKPETLTVIYADGSRHTLDYGQLKRWDKNKRGKLHTGLLSYNNEGKDLCLATNIDIQIADTERKSLELILDDAHSARSLDVTLDTFVPKAVRHLPDSVAPLHVRIDGTRLQKKCSVSQFENTGEEQYSKPLSLSVKGCTPLLTLPEMPVRAATR